MDRHFRGPDRTEGPRSVCRFRWRAGRFPSEVTFVETISAARVRTAAPRVKRYGIACGVLVAALVLSLFSGLAEADQVGPLQARAGQLGSQLAAGARRIHVLTVQFDRASDTSASTSAQLATAETQLHATERQIALSRAVLHRQAVSAYVEGPSAANRGAATGKEALGLILRQEYLTVATGDVIDTLDRLHVGLHTLMDQQAALRQAQGAAERAAQGMVTARQSALAQAAQEQVMLAQVNGQLLTLARQAAQAAMRQAEAQSAARAAAARAVAAHVPAPSQGLPVNGGLVAVVSAATSPPASHVTSGGPWLALRECESGDNYAENSGNGYFGAYQFSQATWTDLGYPGRPDLEPPAMQDQAAQKLQAEGGWGQWPTCAAALGLT